MGVLAPTKPMPDHPATGASESESLPAGEETRSSVEVYEAEDATVLYDADNPMAWLEATTTLTVAEQV